MPDTFHNNANPYDLIKQVVTSDELLYLLDERHAMYEERSTGEVMRIRGFVLAAIEQAGLKEGMLIYVLEELENSQHPYTVAGAAMALRGSKPPFSQAIPYLLKAIENISHHDTAISFEFSNGEHIYTSAKKELIKTLEWYGNLSAPYFAEIKNMRAGRYNLSSTQLAQIDAIISNLKEEDKEISEDCCTAHTPVSAGSFLKQIKASIHHRLPDVTLEDHDGQHLKFKDFFTGQPTIVAFFYTRCENPNKCALTITRLGSLQKKLAQQAELDGTNIKITAITYDPAYDEPYRLKLFCENRGMELNDDNRAMRVVEGQALLQDYFNLGVSYVGNVVNRHRIELYLLDSAGHITDTFTHTQWHEDAVLLQLNKRIKHENKPEFVRSIRKTLHIAYTVCFSLVVAFFPKCPLCWAAYLSAFGLAGSHRLLAYSPWLLYVFITLMGINLWVLWRRARHNNTYLPLYLSIAGAFVIFTFSLILNMRAWGICGVVLIALGSLLNSARMRGLGRMTK